MHKDRVVSFWCASCALFASTIAGAQSGVHFSEIHYDNAGADVGEAVEISGPAGLDLTGWRVVLYNGNGGAPYRSDELSGSIAASCGERGVIVVDYPVNGIQNGDPDGFALVDAAGAVVEFLSYEGVFAAVGDAADGLTATDIGVRETGADPVGFSLARDGAGLWQAPAASTFGACNDEGGVAQPVASVAVAPANATMFVGAALSLSAGARDIDGQPVASAFTWSSSAPGVVSVSNTGVATALAPGDAVVTATAPNGVAGSALLHVDAAPPVGGPLRFTEIHYDNAGGDLGEAIEIEGAPGTSLAGYSVVLYNGNGGVPYHTQALGGVLPESCADRGVALVTYPADGIQNGAPDGFALIGPDAAVVEFRSYEGSFTAQTGPAAGVASADILASQSASTPGFSLQRDAGDRWMLAASSFGACNADAPTPGGNVVFISGRTDSDPALPVGYQDQLFGRLADPNNQTIASSFVWTSETPDTASVDARGVVTALAEGSMTLRATAADGTSSTITLAARIAQPGGTAQYAGNAEFGEPTDADPSDDFIVRYEQYTASYNVDRGTPNWVAYDLDATHFGAEDRCDCFTTDPALPAAFPRISTADYTDAGAFAGYGIDRGHLVRSFDRTTGSLDNARTYLFSNIVPQASDLNQGPWAMFENHLGDLARVDGREVYVLTGVAGNRGTLKDEGKVVIPVSTWKVAVILPRDQGLESIRDYRDLQVMAVDMPNEPGVRNVDWQTWLTTVDAIEALSGYDLLALLEDEVEAAVESNTQPPLARVEGTAAGSVGEELTFSGADSLDPNGGIVSYEWDFGDGSAGSGVTATHAYVQAGTYVVTLKVTDADGFRDTASLSVTVDAAPAELSAALSMVESLVAQRRLSRPLGRLLEAGIDAAQDLLDRGKPAAARLLLGAVVLEVDLLVRLRQLAAGDAAPLTRLLQEVIAGLRP